MASAAIVQVTKSNFTAEVLQSPTPILVDFWAEWCGPCRMIGPVLDELATEFAGRARIGKVNVDEEPELASQFRVNSIPTLLFFKGGNIVEQAVGGRSKRDLKASLEKLVA